MSACRRSGVIAVLLGGIPIDPGAKGIVRVLGVLVERLVGIGESMIRGFRDEIVSRPEVLVEAAMPKAQKRSGPALLRP